VQTPYGWSGTLRPLGQDDWCIPQIEMSGSSHTINGEEEHGLLLAFFIFTSK
jgi:hypothetical protein